MVERGLLQILWQCGGGDVVSSDILMLNASNNGENPRSRIIDRHRAGVGFRGGRGGRVVARLPSRPPSRFSHPHCGILADSCLGARH